MLKVKDVTRLKAFGYNNVQLGGKDVLTKVFKDTILEKYATMFVDTNNGELYAEGDAMDGILEEVFELKSAGLLIRVSDDEKG